MVFAFDEIKGTGEEFPGFGERKGELSESFLDIALAAGDRAHVSGPADYVARITTSKWTFQPLPASKAFVVVDNVDNLLVFQKRGGALESTLTLDGGDDWFEEIRAAFAEFREALGDR